MVGSIQDALAAAIPASALQPPAGTSSKGAVVPKPTSVSLVADASKQNKEDQVRVEDAIKDRDAASEGRPQFPTLAAEPKVEQNEDPTRGYVAAIGVLGAIGSMFTRSPMTESMNAAAATINAMKQGDAEAFKQKFDTWKVKNDNALKLFDYQNATYKDIMASKNKSVDERIAELKANAAAFKDENMMQLLADKNPAVIEDLLAKSTEALASAQKKSAELEKIGNQNQAAFEAIKSAKEDFDAGKLTKEQYVQKLQEAANPGKGGANTKVTLTPEAIDQKVEALRKGANYSSIGLSTRSSSNPDKDAVDAAFAKKYPDVNLADAQLKYAGEKAATTASQRTLATKGAVVELSSNLLNNSLPILEDAFNKVDNSRFKDINSFENYYKDHKNDPDLASLHEAILNTESDLALLMRRGGASTVDSAQRAEKIINDSMSSKSFESVKEQILRESKASREAVQQTKTDLSGTKRESPSQEDLEYTAKKNNMTVDEVKKKLGLSE